MANHSFKCFERKSIHQEIDKVNRMIVRLRITCTKMKNKICKHELTSKPCPTKLNYKEKEFGSKAARN